MHEFFFCFLKRKINLKVLRFFLKYFGENQVFNIRSVFYTVNIQSDIMQN